MLIPRIAFDPATPLDFGEPGSELRSLFLFGDAYVELSPEVTPATLRHRVKFLGVAPAGGRTG